MLLPRVSCLLGGAMSWCWFEPASAVPTIWGYSPRHGGGSPPAAGRKACCERSRRVAHVCSHNQLPTSSLRPPTSRTELPTSDLQPQTSRTSKSFPMHSYEKCAHKSFGIRSYAIVGLKVPWNEYLQKKRWVGGQRDQKASFLAAPKCAALHSVPPGSARRRRFWYIPAHSHFSIWEGLRYRSRTP